VKRYSVIIILLFFNLIGKLYAIDSYGTYEVFASQYAANHDWEVSLPYSYLKLSDSKEMTKTKWVKIQKTSPPNDDIAYVVPVRENGPWNTNDNYWQSETDRGIYRHCTEYWWIDDHVPIH
jgi:hypothetical protein